MKNILVPTDFSDNARKALEYAAGLASRCGSGLHIVHAYTLLENAASETSSLRGAFNHQQQVEKNTALLQDQQFVRNRFPAVDPELHLFTGPVEDVLQVFARENSIDLIVMGTQGASGISELLIGSVTASVIENSAIPVLAIPAGYTGKEPENILLAVRDFNHDTAPLKPVLNMAAVYGVPVHIFAFENDMDSDIEIAEKTRALESFTSFVQQEFPLVRVKAILHEDAAFENAMEEYCSQQNIGMICMLTHKRGFWEKLFNPSLTKKMAYHSTLPLLAIPCS